MSKPRTHWWVVVDSSGFCWEISTSRVCALIFKRDFESKFVTDRPFRVIKVEEVKK
jgi:hypothetical protein